MRMNSQQDGIWKIKYIYIKQTSTTALHWASKLKVSLVKVYFNIPIRHRTCLIQYTSKIPEVRRGEVAFPRPHNLHAFFYAEPHLILLDRKRGNARENARRCRTPTALVYINNTHPSCRLCFVRPWNQRRTKGNQLLDKKECRGIPQRPVTSGEDAEKLKPSYTAVGNVKCCNCLCTIL